MVSLGNDNNGSSLKSKIMKAPRFFKIILQQTIRDRKLRIPPAFARKYGDALPKWVTFRVPSGEIWVVKVERSGGDLFFGKGWHKFSDHFCLKFGHFLVFRYDGNCVFNVLVLDRSATEIEYPLFENVDSDQEADNDSTDHSSSLPEESDGMSMDSQETKDEPFPVEASGLSFKALIHPVNLKHSYLTIPGSFIQKCAMLEKGQSITLVCGGKSWPVNFIRKNGSGILSAGWSAFCKGNCVRAGDVYMFELIKTTSVEHVTLKVSISRDGNEASGLSFTRAVSLKDKHMTVPVSFVQKCSMLEDTQYVTLVCDGKSWPVKFIRNSSRCRCLLSAGWAAFRNGNCLREGDVCNFELIKTCVVGDIRLKVSFSRSGA